MIINTDFIVEQVSLYIIMYKTKANRVPNRSKAPIHIRGVSRPLTRLPFI